MDNLGCDVVTGREVTAEVWVLVTMRDGRVELVTLERLADLRDAGLVVRSLVGNERAWRGGRRMVVES